MEPEEILLCRRYKRKVRLLWRRLGKFLSMGDGRKGRLQKAGEILQWRRTEKGWTAGGWAVKSMRRKERADCKKLWRPFSTGGEKREWRLQDVGETFWQMRREARADCWRLLAHAFTAWPGPACD